MQPIDPNCFGMNIDEKNEKLPNLNQTSENIKNTQKMPKNQIPMNPMVYMMPMMKNMMPTNPDYRYQPMNNYGFFYAMPQIEGNRQPRHCPPYTMFGEQEISNTSVPSNSHFENTNPTQRITKSKSPPKIRSLNGISRSGSVEAPRFRRGKTTMSWFDTISEADIHSEETAELKNNLWNQARKYNNWDEIKIMVNMSEAQSMQFENVKDIREKIDQIFSPQNVKMIWKRAERTYSNGYCVFVLYCNKWTKRKPSYKSIKRYKKRSTGCPFQLKFTKHENEKYRLANGCFYHNHELLTPVLDPQIMKYLNNFDPMTSKPAHVRSFINQQFHKDISYAQIAYELTKRKKKLKSVKPTYSLEEFINCFKNKGIEKKLIIFKDKNNKLIRVMYINPTLKWEDVLVVHKIK